jgi:N-acetylneuraminate synthase
MASLEEIGNAIESAKSAGNQDLALFHCISSYPAPINESNLNLITILRKEFAVQIGLSDHTIGNLAGILATSLGASIIEKHFTLNRSDGGVDSSFSLEPKEMGSLVKQTREAFSALGSKNFMRSEVEESNMIFRRSLYFVKDVNEGEVFSEESVRRIRPGFGLEAKYYSDIIGSRCLKAAKKGDRVTLNHFKLGDL